MLSRHFCRYLVTVSNLLRIMAAALVYSIYNLVSTSNDLTKPFHNTYLPNNHTHTATRINYKLSHKVIKVSDEFGKYRNKYN